jgi:hypothetical protein
MIWSLYHKKTKKHTKCFNNCQGSIQTHSYEIWMSINYCDQYFIDHFNFKHTSFIVYYPQGNGQTKSTNKVFGTLLTKLVNENKNDWDEHMSTILFSYWTACKVGTIHTPFQLVYGLHALLPT